VKEYYFNKNTHIGGWFMPTNLCDDIIKTFHSNKKLHSKGKLGYNDSEKSGVEVNTKDKESTDLYVNPNYKPEPFFTYLTYLQKCLDNYIKKYDFVNGNKKFNIVEKYNIQYYKPNQGFKVWHFENPKDIKRLLVFMTYLNDVEDGGTEFLYQGLKTPAKKGLTIIWPAGWTHTHKGEISTKNEKYIVTGWYSIL